MAGRAPVPRGRKTLSLAAALAFALALRVWLGLARAAATRARVAQPSTAQHPSDERSVRPLNPSPDSRHSKTCLWANLGDPHSIGDRHPRWLRLEASLAPGALHSAITTQNTVKRSGSPARRAPPQPSNAIHQPIFKQRCRGWLASLAPATCRLLFAIGDGFWAGRPQWRTSTSRAGGTSVRSPAVT